MKSIQNKTIFFWGSKWLGKKCLTYLVKRLTNYSDANVIGICVSTTDSEYSKKIREIADSKIISVFTEKEDINIKADLGICIGYPHRISEEAIKNFKNGIINLHFAPLPYYRGSKTLSHAILNDEKKYGLTFHYIDKSLDTGPIIDVKWYPLVKDKSAKQIRIELEKLAYLFFREYLDRMIIDVLPSTPQDEIIKRERITPRFYTRSSIESLYRVSLEESFESIYQKVRALQVDDAQLPFFEKDGNKIYLSLGK